MYHKEINMYIIYTEINYTNYKYIQRVPLSRNKFDSKAE